MSESLNPSWPPMPDPCLIRWVGRKGLWLVTRPNGTEVGSYDRPSDAEAASGADSEEREVQT